MANDPNNGPPADGWLTGMLDLGPVLKAESDKRKAAQARALKHRDDPLEATILHQVERALEKVPGVLVHRYSPLKQQVKGQWVQPVPDGHSDLAGSAPGPSGNRPIYLEVKTRTGKLRTSQKKFLRRHALLGDFVAVVRSVDDALAALAGCRTGDVCKRGDEEWCS